MNVIVKGIGSVLIGLVKVYQYTLSPWMGRSCRYQPTCSNYMIDAIKEWGPIKGSWLGIKRIGRCHPWGGEGLDPVPKKELETENE